jgi:hypothetical protein
MEMALKRMAAAASTIACVALLSFSWSEQRGLSLGVGEAQARVGRPSAPLGVGGIARRQYRRSGSALLAEAVAATTSPWNYDDYYCYDDPYSRRGYPPGSYYYRTYSGGYCFTAGLIGRPTLFPRYYGGWNW